jgi:hypothetical protein
MCISDVLENRTWLRREQPFPHVVARSVFANSFYIALEAGFNQILKRGLSEGKTARRETFSRSIAGYDAYGVGFSQLTKGALAFFSSPEWNKLMAQLFDVPATGHVNIGAHHHAIGSSDGWIHNDLNPVWFPRNSSGGIRYPDHEQCDYKTGAGPLQPSDKIEVVRAVAMIFYLCNTGWVEGNGGETGLFLSATASSDEPCMRIPPENNSILLFECAPFSFHAFLHNPGQARNSIIMWIHRSKKDALRRWHNQDLESWRF